MNTEKSSERIDHWDCEDCELGELDDWEKEAHEELTDHTIVPRYV